MDDEAIREGVRRRGRPQTQTKNYTVRCTVAGWEWLQRQIKAKGHRSVGKWADAFGQVYVEKRMEAMRRAHGLPTRFEADGEGSYGRSVELIQERQGYATAEEFARAMGVSRRTVEGWKAGKKPSGMALKMLRQLAEDKPGEATTVAVPGPLPANARPGGVATDIFERLSEECQ